MGKHERKGLSDEWYTPKYIFDAMKIEFDLDVAHPKIETAVPAKHIITAKSLEMDWDGFVWMNPPWSDPKEKIKWIDKFIDNNNGVALMPDRTSAHWWQHFAANIDALLFVNKKIRFIKPDGTTGDHPANGTTLFASGKKGIYYEDWVKKMKAFGYDYDYKILNAADYDAYTSRIRYFAQFAKPTFSIEWPKPTNSKKANPKNSLFPEDELKPWRAVKDVLDLDELGESIFVPGRITSDKTFERIYGGLIKYVAKENQSQFIQKYYGTGKNVSSLETVSGTIPTKDRMALMSVNHFVYRDFGRETNSSIDNIAGTIPVNPKMNLISTDPLILNYNSSTSPVTSVNEISPTVTTVRTHYIINPSWFSLSTRSLEDPAPTLIARMDKAPHYLVTTETGELAIEVYDTDLPHAVKIKEFMAIYGLKDVLMRMFLEIELLRIMGFPENYILLGNQTENKKFIGNAVEVKQAKAIFKASVKANIFDDKIKVA